LSARFCFALGMDKLGILAFYCTPPTHHYWARKQHTGSGVSRLQAQKYKAALQDILDTTIFKTRSRFPDKDLSSSPSRSGDDLCMRYGLASSELL